MATRKLPLTSMLLRPGQQLYGDAPVQMGKGRGRTFRLWLTPRPGTVPAGRWRGPYVPARPGAGQGGMVREPFWVGQSGGGGSWGQGGGMGGSGGSWQPPQGTWPGFFEQYAQQSGSQGSYLVPPSAAYPPALAAGVPPSIVGVSGPIRWPPGGRLPRPVNTPGPQPRSLSSGNFVPGWGWTRQPSSRPAVPPPRPRPGVQPPSNVPSGASIVINFPDPTQGNGSAISPERWNEIRSRVATVPNPTMVTLAQLPGVRRTQSRRAIQEMMRAGEDMARAARAQGLSTVDYQRKLFEGTIGLRRAQTFADLIRQLYATNTALEDLRRETALAEMMRRLWLLGLFQ